MKIVDAIYTSEKLIQKLLTVTTLLGLLLAILIGLTVYFATKPPLVVERSCDVKILEPSSGKRTPSEVKAFIANALSARFDSDRNKPSLMTETQADLKSRELKEFTARNITQRVFTEEIILKDNGVFTAKLTRLLKVENIRTALGFSIEAKIFEDSRSEDNPYGLILSEVKLLTPEASK